MLFMPFPSALGAAVVASNSQTIGINLAPQPHAISSDCIDLCQWFLCCCADTPQLPPVSVHVAVCGMTGLLSYLIAFVPSSEAEPSAAGAMAKG